MRIRIVGAGAVGYQHAVTAVGAALASLGNIGPGLWEGRNR